MAQAAHVARVRSLYRRALKTSFDWCVTVETWRPRALQIRDRFEANRQVATLREAERLCVKAEEELEEYAHPDPYKCK
jgi:NADH dehydrogenase (ubiquinone) 1 beta subcomplex subunit 9